MNASRDVYLTIGKNSYTIHTSLTNEEFDSIKGLIDEACGEIIKGASQEDMLMLTCLRLAYSLNSINLKLADLAERLDLAN